MRVAEADPLAVGSKATFSCVLCPALSVSGKLAPEIENWGLELDAEFTVTVPPVAVTVIGRLVVVPKFTLPKLNDVGATVSCPTVVVAPVPVTGMLTFGPATKTLPLNMPVFFGVNVTFSVAPCPLFRTSGKLAPLTE